MKKKKITLLILLIVIVGLIGGGVYLFTSKEEKFAYTIEEERWIEENKNAVIDLYMPSDIASLTLDGEGLFFEFVNDFSESLKIKVNPVAYQLGTIQDEEYSILLVDKLKKGDLKIIDDNYVVITKQDVIYNDIESMKGLKIGVLKSEQEEVTKYLGDNVTYVPFDNQTLMLNALASGTTVHGIVGLKTNYLNTILTNNYHIAYHISEMERNYVLRINGSDKTLNSIIKKEYSKWVKNNLVKAYNNTLFNAYINALGISEKEITKLNSKTYTYGFVENGIYDNIYHNDFFGMNYSIIKSFASFANLDMQYEEGFSNLKDLNKALEKGKVDFYFDNTIFNLKNTDTTTISPIVSEIAIIKRTDNKAVVNSINSLDKTKVLVIKDSKIEEIFKKAGIKVTSYNNYEDMFDKLTDDSVIAMELSNYEYYKVKELGRYHVAYILPEQQNYGYAVNKDNKVFIDLFNFYLEYNDLDEIIDMSANDIYQYEGLNIFLLIAVIVLSIVVILQLLGNIKKIIKYFIKKRSKTLTKDEKLKYIDNLTSLKNRAYLNDNIEKWDNSEIYPQILVVIDLNNIAYINDNFGHEEGDKVITEAANILIQTQLPNTEIIRTDGNEFLVYMVEYEEKKATAYIRKLNKEFKNLSHEFGAAIGYSIINDAIKTIDDAINEATLDMKTNKELMMEEEK